MPQPQDPSPPVVEVPVAALAAALRVNARRVQQLAKEGIVASLGRGRYGRVASVKGWLAAIEQSHIEAMTSGARDYDGERTRLTSARADKAELELTILRGDAVLMPDVEALVAEEYGAFRLGLSQISGGIARKLANTSDPAACQEIVAEAIEGALSNLTADQPGGKRPHTRHLPGADSIDDDED